MSRLFSPARFLAALLVCWSAAATAQPRAYAERPKAASDAKPTIVLVHGAFADATGFQRIIPMLERDGYHVVAVQNSLRSLADDVATTKRLIDAQTGPIVVVGHSYGGAVMTGAADNPRVKALVYLAAFAPDVGEPLDAHLAKYPAELGAALRPDAGGFLWIDRAAFRKVFAGDIPAADASTMAITQKPVAASIFKATLDRAAWKTVPSWFLISLDDHTVSPGLARFYAERMKAKTTEIRSSHVAFISHPAAVVKVIEEAATAK